WKNSVLSRRSSVASKGTSLLLKSDDRRLTSARCYHREYFPIMHILFIGDIFGRPGRNIVKDRLPGLVKDRAIDLVIANGENSAGGFGLTGARAEDLCDLGIDLITTGNHIWDKREIIDYFQSAVGNQHSPARRLLRP